MEVTLSENGAEDDNSTIWKRWRASLPPSRPSAAKPSSSSAEILARIEEELRSIRTDLTQLRGELSGLREDRRRARGRRRPSEAEAQGGFFDEDEDETIALTGDELDNILNTAEITEEAAESPSA